jgi:hypothetical protein
MEKLKPKKSLTRAVILTLGLAVATACSAESTTHTGETTASDVFTTLDVEVIRPGQSAFSGLSTDTEEHEAITDDLDIVDEQHPNSWDDDGAPLIGQLPVRVDAHQSFTNEAKAGFSNDIGCDSLPLDLQGLDSSGVYVGAVALSDSDDDRVLISWPRTDGKPANHILMCMDDTREPADGVVLFVSDQQR